MLLIAVIVCSIGLVEAEKTDGQDVTLPASESPVATASEPLADRTDSPVTSQNDVRDRISSFLDKLKSHLEDLKEKIEERREEIRNKTDSPRDVFEDIVDRLHEAIGYNASKSFQENLDDLRDRIGDNVEEAREEIRKQIDAIRQALEDLKNSRKDSSSKRDEDNNGEEKDDGEGDEADEDDDDTNDDDDDDNDNGFLGPSQNGEGPRERISKFLDKFRTHLKDLREKVEERKNTIKDDLPDSPRNVFEEIIDRLHGAIGFNNSKSFEENLDDLREKIGDDIEEAKETIRKQIDAIRKALDDLRKKESKDEKDDNDENDDNSGIDLLQASQNDGGPRNIISKFIEMLRSSLDSLREETEERRDDDDSDKNIFDRLLEAIGFDSSKSLQENLDDLRDRLGDNVEEARKTIREQIDAIRKALDDWKDNQDKDNNDDEEEEDSSSSEEDDRNLFSTEKLEADFVKAAKALNEFSDSMRDKKDDSGVLDFRSMDQYKDLLKDMLEKKKAMIQGKIRARVAAEERTRNVFEKSKKSDNEEDKKPLESSDNDENDAFAARKAQLKSILKGSGPGNPADGQGDDDELTLAVNVALLKEYGPRIQEVAEKKKEFLKAEDELNDLRSHSSGPFNLSEFKDKLKEMLEKKKDWIASKDGLKLDIVETLKKLARDLRARNSTVNPFEFFDVLDALRSSSMSLPDLLKKYNDKLKEAAEWKRNSGSDSQSGNFLKSALPSGDAAQSDEDNSGKARKSMDDSINMAAALGDGGDSKDFSGTTALIVVGCVAVAATVVVVGVVVGRQRRRHRLYKRIPIKQEQNLKEHSNRYGSGSERPLV